MSIECGEKHPYAGQKIQQPRGCFLNYTLKVVQVLFFVCFLKQPEVLKTSKNIEKEIASKTEKEKEFFLNKYLMPTQNKKG